MQSGVLWEEKRVTKSSFSALFCFNPIQVMRIKKTGTVTFKIGITSHETDKFVGVAGILSNGKCDHFHNRGRERERYPYVTAINKVPKIGIRGASLKGQADSAICRSAFKALKYLAKALSLSLSDLSRASHTSSNPSTITEQLCVWCRCQAEKVKTRLGIPHLMKVI